MKTPLQQLFLELLEAWEADEHRLYHEFSGNFNESAKELEAAKAEWLKRFKAATAGRFAAFAYDNFYPSGGIGDCVGTFGTAAEARAFLREHYRSSDHTEVHDLLKTAANAWRQK